MNTKPETYIKHMSYMSLTKPNFKNITIIKFIFFQDIIYIVPLTISFFCIYQSCTFYSPRSVKNSVHRVNLSLSLSLSLSLCVWITLTYIEVDLQVSLDSTDRRPREKPKISCFMNRYDNWQVRYIRVQVGAVLWARRISSVERSPEGIKQLKKAGHLDFK